MKFKRLVTFIIIIFVGRFTFGEDHYPDRARHPHVVFYHSSLKSDQMYIDDILVKAGDNIVLDTGERVVFKRALGQGNNTVIFEDDKGRAVRIPKDPLNILVKNYMFQGYKTAMAIINESVDSSYSVKILEHDYRSRYVTFVERLDIAFNAETFLNLPDLDRRSPRYLKLIEFIDAFRVFEFIDDFRSFQIVWVKERGWVLIDIGAYIRLSESGKIQNIERTLFKYWGEDVPLTVLENLKNDIHDFIRTPRMCSLILN